MRVPVVCYVDAAREPHAIVLSHIIDETLERSESSRPPN
jgi:hypothetical protein